MKLERICSDSYCRKKFTCNGECEIERRIELENACFCPDCAEKTRVEHSYFFSENELCRSRFGDVKK